MWQTALPWNSDCNLYELLWILALFTFTDGALCFIKRKMKMKMELNSGTRKISFLTHYRLIYLHPFLFCLLKYIIFSAIELFLFSYPGKKRDKSDLTPVCLYILIFWLFCFCHLPIIGIYSARQKERKNFIWTFLSYFIQQRFFWLFT